VEAIRSDEKEGEGVVNEKLRPSFGALTMSFLGSFY